MMPGTNPPPAISTLRHEYVSAAGAAAAAGTGVACGATRAAATTAMAASAWVVRMIDHFLVGSFAGACLPVGVGGTAARCPLRSSREAHSGAGWERSQLR